MKQDSMLQVATYWNSIASQFDSIYSGEKNALARAMDHWLRRDMYERFDWVMRKSGDVRGLSVCDMGCGSGRFMVEFAKRGADRVTGIDLAPEMLHLSRGLAAREKVSGRCDFFEADIFDWVPEQQFDLTLAIGLWDCITDPSQRLRNIRRITSGTFLSAWPRLWTLRAPLRKVRLQYLQGCPVYFYSKDRVYGLLEQAHFRIRSCETIGALFCVEAEPA